MLERRVRVFGSDALVLEAGRASDPPVVFLHGLGSGARAWSSLLPPFAARGFRCLAVDLPGFGDTPPPAPPRRFPRPGRELAGYVAELLDALKLERAHLVGWSLGGGVALHAAAHVPERVSRLVLAAPAGLGPEVAWGLRLLGMPVLGPWLARRPLPPLPPGDGPVSVAPLAEKPLPRDFVVAHVEMSRHPWYAEVQLAIARQGGLLLRGQRDMMLDVPLASLGQPILILWGREDRVLPVRQGLRAAERLPRARLVVLESCGHCLPVEYPERFLSEATAFLAEEQGMADRRA